MNITVEKRGLPNIGNTCFANSIMQILFNTPELTSILEKYVVLNSREEYKNAFSFIKHFMDVREHRTPQSIQCFFQSKEFQASGFAAFEQQDAQEFYSWDPHIDWDKFVNFQNYYWLPYGPDTITIFGQQNSVTSTYTVQLETQGSDYQYLFTPDGLTPNQRSRRPRPTGSLKRWRKPAPRSASAYSGTPRTSGARASSARCSRASYRPLTRESDDRLDVRRVREEIERAHARQSIPRIQQPSCITRQRREVA